MAHAIEREAQVPAGESTGLVGVELTARDERVAPAVPAGDMRRTARAFGDLAIATILGQAIGFGALALVARRVGPGLLGAYSLDLAIATYVGVAGNFGITYLTTRDVSQAPENRWRLLVEATLLVVLVLVPLCAVVVLSSGVWLPSPVERRLLLPVMLGVAVAALTPDWYLLALRRSRVVGIARLGGQLLYGTLVVLLLARSQTGVERYAWFNAVGVVVTGVVIVSVASQGARGAWRARDAPMVDLRALRLRVRRSLPFGYSLLVLQLYAGVAIPILSVTSNTREVGLYAVAARLPLALTALVNVWLMVFFPHGAATARRSLALLGRDVGKVLSVTAVASVALACAAPFAARELMPLIFGKHFAGAATPFSLLALAAALVMIQATTSNVLLATGNERKYGKIITGVAVTMLAVDIPLCVKWGAIGAGVAAVGAEIMIVALTGRAVRRVLGGLQLDWRTLRWAAPLGVGTLATGLLRVGERASPLDLVLPTVGGATFTLIVAACLIGLKATHADS